MSARDLPDDLLRAHQLNDALRAKYLAPPPNVNVAEWADEYRYVAKGPERGKWRNTRTPYLVEPMEAASAYSPYDRVVLWFATQMGKTEVLYNSILQRVHTDPQDMMMVQPTLQDAKDHSQQRFLPTVVQTSALDGLVAVRKSRDESTSWMTRSIQGGFALFFAGANSGNSLASKPLGFAVAHEVDKWPYDVDNLGPPLGQLEERMSNFARRMLLIASTCTIKGASLIETEYALSDQRKYHVPCPHCGERQVLTWGAKTDWGIKWLKDAGGKARPETAVYVCQHCGSTIEEWRKDAMLRDGIWIPDAPGASLGKRAGYWMNKLYSPLGWKSWAALVEEFDSAMAEYRLSKSGPLKKFKNNTLAETWEEEGHGADSKSLAARAEDYKLGIVPRGGLMLTMGVDTQPDRLEARVWAFGRGEESWLVGRHIIYGDPNLDEGTEGSPWTRLTEIRRTPLLNAIGAQMLIEATGIDTGGHNTHAVYHYCRSHSHANVLALKGASQYGKPVIGKPSQIDVNWRGRTIPRGVKLWSVGTDTVKHLLHGRMRITEVGPGYVHVPESLKTTDEFEQMTAASLKPSVVQGKAVMRWVTAAGKREEGGDAMGYAYAAACWLGIQNYREPSWARREAKYCPRDPGLFDQPVGGQGHAAQPATEVEGAANAAPVAPPNPRRRARYFVRT